MPETKNCEKTCKCPMANHCMCVDDDPNQLAHLGFRFAYTCIAWFILGMGISEGTSFFVSIALFAMPLLMDYLKFNPRDKMRIRIKTIEIIVVGFWVIVGVLGSFGVFEIIKLNGEFILKTSDKFIAMKYINVKLSDLWFWIGSSVCIAAVDWVCSSSILELGLNKSTDKKVAK